VVDDASARHLTEHGDDTVHRGICLWSLAFEAVPCIQATGHKSTRRRPDGRLASLSGEPTGSVAASSLAAA
jgi:hypothetical protein